MKIADFERAIKKLDVDVHIDEISLCKGQVKELYAHTKRRYLKYTGLGTCYSLPSTAHNSTEEYKMSRQIFRLSSHHERVPQLDLPVLNSYFCKNKTQCGTSKKISSKN